MNYRLVVLTHGDSLTLAETLASFDEMVEPAPKSRDLICDGPFSELPPEQRRHTWYVEPAPSQQGFCPATARTWRSASHGEHDFVFYLEHDFRFLQPVDLRQLAAVLEVEQEVAQISLARDATPHERDRGADTVFGHPRELFEERDYVEGRDLGPAEHYPYLVHDIYFTTNPSLMRRRFMVENPWPDYPQWCEGRFGLDLVARGYLFAIWGGGEPWLEHIGRRDGKGY